MSDTTASAEETLQEMSELLVGSNVRIVFTFGLNLSRGGSLQGLYLETKRTGTDKRWCKVGPTLYPPEGGSRADLLETLAGMIRKQEELT